MEINPTSYSVNRDVWFVSKNQSYTLQIPYSATYVYANGSWSVGAEWFGTAADAGTVLSGMQAPANSTTTTIPVTVNATTVTQNTTTLI